MANTRWQYVRKFEEEDSCLRNTFIVVRIDGRGFSRFTKAHEFQKPNDRRALSLMNRAALDVMKEFSDIFIAYGQSDEYSFAFRRDAQVFKRRRSKIMSTIVSLFSAAYVFYWQETMGETCKLKSVPQFDARIVLYPSLDNLADYFRWRQSDCHINNLFNTTFWALVQKGGRSETEAEAELSGTYSKDKHELLFSEFQINYDSEEQIYRKGSVLLRFEKKLQEPTVPKDEKALTQDAALNPVLKGPAEVCHVDIIKPKFWTSFAQA